MAVHKDNDEERQQRVEAVLKQMREQRAAPASRTQPPFPNPRARTAPKNKESG